MVAFHFQFSNQAGWKCDECRNKGLEMKRRCGWMPTALATPERVVWARERTSTTECPRSYITAQSWAWIEEFYVWRRLGNRLLDGLEAKKAEAFLLLESELAAARGEQGVDPGGG